MRAWPPPENIKQKLLVVDLHETNIEGSTTREHTIAWPEPPASKWSQCFVREFWEEGNFVERFAGTFDFVCRVACILWEHSFVAVIFGFRSESAMIRRNKASELEFVEEMIEVGGWITGNEIKSAFRCSENSVFCLNFIISGTNHIKFCAYLIWFLDLNAKKLSDNYVRGFFLS